MLRKKSLFSCEKLQLSLFRSNFQEKRKKEHKWYSLRVTSIKTSQVKILTTKMAQNHIFSHISAHIRQCINSVSVVPPTIVPTLKNHQNDGL